jgi:peptidoglycan/LPS O-acetylase OafA/YrhL
MLYRYIALSALIGGICIWFSMAWLTTQDFMTWHTVLFHGLLSAMMPFMIGVYIYKAKVRQMANVPHWLALIAAIAYVWLVTDKDRTYIVYRLILAIASGSIITYYLSHIDLRPISRWWHETDMLLGHMAYPLLLVHELAATAILLYTGYADGRGDVLLQVSLPVACMISLLLYVFFEKPLHRLRGRLRT